MELTVIKLGILTLSVFETLIKPGINSANLNRNKYHLNLLKNFS